MFKGRHFDHSVILLCVRWYLAYNLSLRDLEEMMAERGIAVDHTTIHPGPFFRTATLEHFPRSVDDRSGMSRDLHQGPRPVDVSLPRHRQCRRHSRILVHELPSAKRFFRKALARHGRPDRVVIDGSQTNQKAIVSCDITNRLQDSSRVG